MYYCIDLKRGLNTNRIQYAFSQYYSEISNFYLGYIYYIYIYIHMYICIYHVYMPCLNR